MERNPQAEQMADASMLRNLAAQAALIWPVERALFDRYALGGDARILDVGCGSGEITSRLGRLYPGATVLGVDVLEAPLAVAREVHAPLAPRVSFVQGDAYALDLPTGTFDLVVCRHVTQSVPHPERILAELVRVCRPGGWVHVLSEDYGMLHLARPGGAPDPQRLWDELLPALCRETGTDERIGRRTWSLARDAGLEEIAVDYVTVDTVRSSRATFADILAAWRDGYAGALAARGGVPEKEVRALFDAAVAGILDPGRYSVWQVPIVSGRKPPR